MSRLIQLVLSGAVSGSVLAIMSSGLVLTYQTSGIFNFGHAAIAFATAYLFFELNTGLHWPVFAAAGVSVLVFAPLLGLALDRLLLRRLATAPIYARIVGTIGLLIALPNLALLIVEQAQLRGASIPDHRQVFNARGLGPTPPKVWRLGDVTLDSNQAIMFGVAAFAAAAFWYLLRHTALGLAMRADVDQRSLASLRGINSRHVSACAWMLATTLAGLGGVCLAPFIGLDSNAYVFLVLGSMAAVIIARFRSLPQAFVGGLALGIVANLVAGYADSFLPDAVSRLSGLRAAVPYLLTFVALVIFGRPGGRKAGTSAREAPSPDPRDGLPMWRRWAPWVVFCSVLMAYVALWADDFWAGLVARGLVLALIFLSFVVVTGLGGMVSLAQPMFVTAGAFATGWLLERGQVFSVSVLAAAVLGGVIGGLIAFPVRRLGALEVALATLSLGFVADLIVFQLDSVRNRSTGYRVEAPLLGPLDLSNPRVFAATMLVVFGLVTWAVVNLERSATGRAILAARSSDVAARTTGLSPDVAKVTVFAVSGAIAAFGGALFAIPTSPFTNTTVPPFVGLIWLAVIVTWGVRRPAGALMAGLTFTLAASILAEVLPDGGVLGDLTGSASFLPILFGLGAINLAKDPNGLLSMAVAHRRSSTAARQVRLAKQASETSDGAVGNEPTALDPSTVAATPGAGAPEPLDTVMEVRGLRVGYGEVDVLHGVDLSVGSGEVLALLGPNGAGKSTLCAAAAGLLKSTEGSVLLEGADITPMPPHERARSGVMLAPEVRGVFPGLTVEENLALVLDLQERRAAYGHFPVLGERRRQLAGSLSGGEQQMLALVSALVKPPRILIADMPTLGLSPQATETVMRVLGDLRRSGTAVLLVEEKVGEVLELADRVAVMSLGRITWTGPARELDPARLETAYLGDAPASAYGPTPVTAN